MVAALRRNNVDAELAATNDNGEHELDVPLSTLSEFEGVPVRFFKRDSPPGKGPLAHALREFSIARSYTRWLNENIQNYQLIHVHALFSYMSSATMRMARKESVPYFSHPIGSLDAWSLQQSKLRKRIFLALIERANLRHAKRVHCTTQLESDQALQAVPGMATFVLPLGLDSPPLLADANARLKRRLKLHEGAQIILFLGRLHPKKGLDHLIDAVGVLNQPQVHLVIAGSGDRTYQSMLKHKVEALGLAPRVTWLGHVSGDLKNECLQGSDLFALTSHAENFGIAVIEALAAQTPVLISPHVGLAQELEHHGIAKVTPLSADCIAQRLDHLLSSQTRLEQMGKLGRQYVQTAHNWDSIAQQLNAHYQQAIS